MTAPAPRAGAGVAGRPGPGTSADRLARLLNLVPYLIARPGIALAEAAADLGVTEKQLREDLELLWMCGLPGYGPGDLIDMAFDGDRVTITYDAGIDRPLRLTPDEALALVVALRMLAETPGMGNRDAIERALAKIESSAGELAGAPVAVRLPGNADRLAQIRAAVERRRAMRITYYTATRDETGDRVVDPIRVFMVDGRAYLEAWCRRAEAVRLFRTDRIDALAELDEPAVPPPQAQLHDLTDGVFQPTTDLPLVQLRVGRGGRWVTEYYPCEEITDTGGGDWLVSLRVTDLSWGRRLVLGLGPEVTVLSPPELVEQVREHAAAALDAYAAPAGDPG
jgi:proteasome accessory factor C